MYREVTLYNAGNSPITVSNVYVEGGYYVEGGEGWPPTADGPEPATLDPGDLQIVTVKYTNAGGPLETTWGKLVILSDDGAKPTWEVLLNAQKVEGGDCLVQFVPSSLDYGLTTPWTEHVQTLQLVNIGSVPCAYHSAITDDCAEVQNCTVSVDGDMADSSSEKFTVTGQPEVGSTLGPGRPSAWR